MHREHLEPWAAQLSRRRAKSAAPATGELGAASYGFRAAEQVRQLIAAHPGPAPAA
jgi:hypothetical protein